MRARCLALLSLELKTAPVCCRVSSQRQLLPISSPRCLLPCPVYRFTLFKELAAPGLSQSPHRPPGSHPGSPAAWDQVLWVSTLRLLLGCTKQR